MVRIEIKGQWGGATGGWRPAVTGTLNQTGQSDEVASTFDGDEISDEAVALLEGQGAVHASDAPEGHEGPVWRVVQVQP